ncbi:MAG: BlaI/MecI/CopY family transcriptional regulator [Muribaculaceae bacterium]|nr:BlaI/MecI/CopY family transcriptional regulator [Muribaculaceae bacterium]
MPRTKSKYPRLTEREAEVMEQLWEHGAMTVRQLLDTYPDPRPHVNTVSTTVRILEDKGYVSHEPESPKPFKYFAVAQAADFAGRSLAQVIKSYFNNSYTSAVSALVEEEKISVDELRQIIDMIEGKDKNQ